MQRIRLPGWVSAAVDAPATRIGLRLLGLVGAVLLVSIAAFGPVDPRSNPAPRLLFVVVWAGLVPLSLVAPGAWRAIDPSRGLSLALAKATGDPEDLAVRRLPEGIGWWPAVGVLAVFLLVEAVWPDEPVAVLAFVAAGGLVQVGGAAVYGRRWHPAADPYGMVAEIVGRLSPVARDGDGRFALSSPRRRLDTPVPPGGMAAVGLLAGAALADFLADTPTWICSPSVVPARPRPRSTRGH